MKYAIYEDPITHRFGYLPVPARFKDGDRLPPIVIRRWFESHEAAVAAVSELLADDEAGSAAADDAVPADAATLPVVPPHRPFFSFQH